MQRIVELETGVEDFSLAQAFFLLADLYEKVDAHAQKIAAPLNLLCHPGCSACCRQSVFITPLEALYVLHHMQETFAPEKLQRAVAQGVKTFESERERILSFGNPHCPGAPALLEGDVSQAPVTGDRVEPARLLHFDCPLLDDAGLCTVYAARELRARLFAVSRLKSRNEYYACDLLGQHLDGRDVTLMDAEAVFSMLQLYPLTRGEQVIPYYLWRYSSLLV